MADQASQIREQIMNQIPSTIHKFLQGVSTPIRILGDTPNSLLDSGDYLASLRPFVSKTESSIRDCCPDIQTCFIAVNIYPGNHAFFVLDVNNVDYVYETAHTNTTPIPIYVLRLSKRKISITRQHGLDATIAERVRAMHNGHGDDPLPLLDDFNQTVEYHSPRNLRR
ncbi:hypothetical protein N7466_008610 [Penicillium verhagenii]|uniref:uncharacterized protein n=1 Tax=Penicillium verhagenii TaxID=1562060 RepID=UPI0025457CB9|nr:uncharacterized protein N7466_008610 [Penicillium verhagenii]KAJ5924423.1 hypothetical protein N7466_008610 [Penicillium verhagenii]